MPPAGFEPTISVGERPQTYALDRAAIGIGFIYIYIYIYNNNLSLCRRKTPVECDEFPIAALMNRVECKKYKRYGDSTVKCDFIYAFYVLVTAPRHLSP